EYSLSYECSVEYPALADGTEVRNRPATARPLLIAAAVLARPGLLARPVRLRSQGRSLASLLAAPVVVIAATTAVMTPAWAGSEGPASMASGSSSSLTTIARMTPRPFPLSPGTGYHVPAVVRPKRAAALPLRIAVRSAAGRAAAAARSTGSVTPMSKG
ncbi:MAG: hypothetical protein QOG28_2983, partial [Trebonia sp.]|nr:hypothetical protein [Trebonia sp.]